MAEVMSQQGFGMSVPSSRQDVISELLNEYGTSFGRGDGSPCVRSPVLADKELPPPPPRSDSLEDKPLPAVQRAEQRMSMKFQLRVIEDAPLSPNSSYKDPSQARAGGKIPFRSLSRNAKPPSLSLVTSNGSTAIIPTIPALSAQAHTYPIPSNFDNKDLPSPPQLPAKSERRSNAQRAHMGSDQSKSQSDLPRNDSLLSQDTERPAPAATSAKRKALPAPAAGKFLSLAQLGTGPRGGKRGPLPPTSAPRKKSVDAQAPVSNQKETMQLKEEEGQGRDSKQQRDAPQVNQPPPTPEEDKFVAAPAPPRKVFTGLGLPPNPRARGPISPKHVRGKSSTGFNLFKAQRPAPPPPTKGVEHLTPEMTPSPTLKPAEAKDQVISPLSPPPPPTEHRRPFSFEHMTVPISSPKDIEQPKTAVPIITLPWTTVPHSDCNTPLGPKSAELPEPSPLPSASPRPAPAPTYSQPETSAAAQDARPAAAAATAPASPIENAPTPPPPFTPLTRAPIPLPQTLIPAITSAHLSCYTNHTATIWSNNAFQPMGCMVCRANDRERKWCCTWCQLRICRSCSEELRVVPGRNLGRYLDERGERGGEGMLGGGGDVGAAGVLSAVYERDEGVS
ncbi:hypothetical protein BDU57DRAFT_324467 [Ampelomyces quisqualis]|uniref:Uncharacterized protein n=1 Tax=Ampelomyces quisqualis TaxID=50730 RepID=A0A6A5QGL8_AMPQU|nr:hypothetical protein BDU57DRAFT_324467 [Ampelomyces quisqualis]